MAILLLPQKILEFIIRKFTIGFLKEKENYIFAFKEDRVKTQLSKYIEEGTEILENDVETINQFIEKTQLTPYKTLKES